MSTIDYVQQPGTPIDGMVIIRWTLAGDDVGKPMAFGSFADKTVQAYGTIDPTGPIIIEGSNDPLALDDPDSAIWVTLTDNLGNEISFDSAGMALIVEAPWAIRPNAGTGTTDAVIAIVANKS